MKVTRYIELKAYDLRLIPSRISVFCPVLVIFANWQMVDGNNVCRLQQPTRFIKFMTT